jgi:hypothetical protein
MYLAGKKNLPVLWAGIAAALLGAILAITSSLDLLRDGMNIIVAQRFTRLPVLLYATGIILVARAFIDQKKTTRRFNFADPYVVYLLHTLVLRVFMRLPGVAQTFGIGLGSVVVVGASFLVAGIIRKVVKR